MKKYIRDLYDTYAKDNYKFKKILDSIIKIPKIPIETLSKTFAQLYTIESNFYRNINTFYKIYKDIFYTFRRKDSI